MAAASGSGSTMLWPCQLAKYIGSQYFRSVRPSTCSG
jgi:hypothetical protein